MKEYLNRWDKPLVNPGFTWGQYETERKNRNGDQCNCSYNRLTQENKFLFIHHKECNVSKNYNNKKESS